MDREAGCNIETSDTMRDLGGRKASIDGITTQTKLDASFDFDPVFTQVLA